MASDDWAVVVGINLYPELSNLEGPENDANSFYDWLVSKSGGDVPADHIARILSSQFAPEATATHAEPNISTVQEAFEDLQDFAEDNRKHDKGFTLGRRLYIYLAGHGCAPRFNDAALLTANANRIKVGYHVLGKLYADWFLRSNVFSEAVLLMDCCRESYPQAPPNIPPYIDINGPDPDKAKTFYGFGTKWSRLSRERPMADGKVHGVFTWALLKGLAGDACDVNTGQITAANLGNYLYNNMKTFLRPQDLDDPEVPKEPDLIYDNNPANVLLFATIPVVPTYPVKINLSVAAGGKRVDILNDKLQSVNSVIGVPPSLEIRLKRGTYLAQVLEAGLQTPPFEVTVIGEGALNVQL